MKQTCRTLLLLSALSVSGLVSADNLFGRAGFETVSEVLPVDEAFKFDSLEEGDTLRLFWQVLPGYYLYRDKFLFEQAGEVLQVDMPRGELRQDEIFGEVEVLTGLVEVTLPRSEATQVVYQGCAERGYCYPPQKRQLTAAK